jgi:predicted transcriptional regulator
LCSAAGFPIDKHMKQLLVEIDEETFKKLERIAPARSRRRSAFIRAAIHKAICETQEHDTAAAYRRVPDSADDTWFDARVWEPKAPAYRGRRRR